ncbi:protein FAM217A [Ambystoma mexicanum]|uniref:protein FAM217A n=1 Tax=Ambystoma mexicanum TaxID=8296 RepID=UPI0037E91578
MKNLYLTKHNLLQYHKNTLLSRPKQLPYAWNNTAKHANGTVNRHLNNQVDTNHTTGAGTLKIYKRSPDFSSIPVQQQKNFIPQQKRMPLEFQWSFDTMDRKNRTERATVDEYPTTETSSDIFANSIRHQNKCLMESTLTDESDVSESDSPDDVQLSYCKHLDMTLSPEVIQNVEGSFPAAEAQVFSYADVLPPSLNAFDLQELASPDCTVWKKGADPSLERAFKPLVSRLFEMEKMQFQTMQKERSKASQTHLNSSAIAGSGTPRGIYKPKQSIHSDQMVLPTNSDGHIQEVSPAQGADCRKCKSKSSKCLRYSRKWNFRTSGIRDSSRSHCKCPRLTPLSQLVRHRLSSRHPISSAPASFVEVARIK